MEPTSPSAASSSSTSSTPTKPLVSPTVPTFDRPRVILYRFVDVLITEGRIKHNYMTMASENLYDFLNEFWHNRDLKELINDMREQSLEERDRNGGGPVIFKESQPPAAIIVSASKVPTLSISF